jgi:hypothetical protein
MGQIDVYFLGCQLQVYGGHAPGAFDAQNAPVKLTIFHTNRMAIHAAGVHTRHRLRGTPPAISGTIGNIRGGGGCRPPPFRRLGRRLSRL